jgi:N-hydroxyarylamine O-acetyltransferase
VPDLDALLDRIGLDAPPPATLDGLRTLHRAYLTRVPYESLAIQLGEIEALDVDRVAERLLSGGRGGYCFELNGVLGWMLEALGFSIERHEAVVGDREPEVPVPTNHLALVVALDGERWLADAGLGEGPVDPLPLVGGVHESPPPSPLAWSLELEPDGNWWIGQHAWCSYAGFRMSAPVVELSAFDPHHERLSTSPESNFVRTLVVQRPYADRVVSLRSRTLSVDGPGLAERRLLSEPDELADVLLDEFAIDPTVLGPARLERLWERACVQHDAWLATR